MATGQSFFGTREQAILNCYLRGTAITAPAALYMGLFGAPAWLSAHTYSVGDFVCSTTTSNTRLFKCTTGGASGGAIPAAFATATDGQTGIADNVAVWKEETMDMEALTDATANPPGELGAGNVTAAGYARLSIGLTAFPAASAIGGTTSGSQSLNTGAITFAAATGNWSPVLGFFLSTVISGTAGLYILYSRFSNQVQVNNTQQLQFNASGVTIAQD